MRPRLLWEHIHREPSKLTIRHPINSTLDIKRGPARAKTSWRAKRFVRMTAVAAACVVAARSRAG